MNKYLDITGLSEVAKQVHNLVDNSNLEKITYANLVAKRNAGKLIPGKFYRIIDFVTMVDPTNISIRSAGNQFDIIVLALDTNILSEEAYAAQSSSTTYFANCKLEAWKVWYCLDNDVTRFVWVDKNNGKGVIYRLIDEYNNDIPYDFKNIKFFRAEYLPENYNELYIDTYTGVYMSIDINDKPCDYFYTFSKHSTGEDLSIINNEFNMIQHNVINKVITDSENDNITYYNTQLLNNIVFILEDAGPGCICSYNTWKGCLYMTFLNNLVSNTFNEVCYNINGIDVAENLFKFGVHNVELGKNCYASTIGQNCQDLYFIMDNSNIQIGDESHGILIKRGNFLSFKGCNANILIYTLTPCSGAEFDYNVQQIQIGSIDISTNHYFSNFKIIGQSVNVINNHYQDSICNITSLLPTSTNGITNLTILTYDYDTNTFKKLTL